jgi:hypothetical protein
MTGANGTPLFVPAIFANFDASGVCSLANTVPPGLTGIVLSFTTFGFVPNGKVRASNEVAVSFQ